MNKRVTMKDVAAEVGVSTAVVSYVINNTPNKSVSKQTRERVWDAVKKLGYTPNAIARQMKTSGSRSIALAYMVEMEDATFNLILKGITQKLFDSGFTATLCPIDSSTGEEEYVDLYRSSLVGGVIILASYGGRYFLDEIRHERAIKRNKIPAVIINGIATDRHIKCVSFDFYATSYKSTQYLFDLGHRNIIYCYKDENSEIRYQSDERKRGFIAATEKLRLSSSDMLQINDLEDYINVNGVPDAIIAAKTDVAIDVYRLIANLGISIPRDVSVIAASYNPGGLYMIPPLTMVYMRFEEIGQSAASALLDTISGNTEYYLEPIDCMILESESCAENSGVKDDLSGFKCSDRII
ncbi:MAG: LacI family transcriptional regulator [Clostridiales bacterium]|nr:LacI family transcriptional regulator [Clostridiales bacterium]